MNENRNDWVLMTTFIKQNIEMKNNIKICFFFLSFLRSFRFARRFFFLASINIDKSARDKECSFILIIDDTHSRQSNARQIKFNELIFYFHIETEKKRKKWWTKVFHFHVIFAMLKHTQPTDFDRKVQVHLKSKNHLSFALICNACIRLHVWPCSVQSKNRVSISDQLHRNKRWNENEI